MIHGDLHYDNVMVVGDDVSGLLDFEFCAYDWRAMELAVALSKWVCARESITGHNGAGWGHVGLSSMEWGSGAVFALSGGVSTRERSSPHVTLHDRAAGGDRPHTNPRCLALPCRCRLPCLGTCLRTSPCRWWSAS